MTYVCNGICFRFKDERVINGSKYEDGRKRCTLCNTYMVYSDPRCPCCNALLRTKSRYKKTNLV